MTTTTAIDRPRPPALAAVGMPPVGTDLGWVRHLVPNGPDITRASPARVWDALLGGAANFAVDRRIADELLAAEPSISWWVGGHQRFLRRAVHHMLDRGIRQFLDLGCGLSTIGGTPQLLAATGTPYRLVSVDIDPVAVHYLRHHLADTSGAAAQIADVRHINDMLNTNAVQSLLDLGEPVGVLAVAVLHHVTDPDQPGAILHHLRDALAPGSVLALSHPSTPGEAAPVLAAALAGYRRDVAPWVPRTPADGLRLLDGWSLLRPGITPLRDPDARRGIRSGRHPSRLPPPSGWAVLAAR